MMSLKEIMILKFNMAKFGLCSLIEADKLEYLKVLNYQDMLIEDRKTD